MTIDVFVLQIMISGEIQAVNIGNTRLVPGFPQGSNSLEKASALALQWLGNRCGISSSTRPQQGPGLSRAAERRAPPSSLFGRARFICWIAFFLATAEGKSCERQPVEMCAV
mgnify:CR=1 FL=1